MERLEGGVRKINQKLEKSKENALNLSPHEKKLILKIINMPIKINNSPSNGQLREWFMGIFMLQENLYRLKGVLNVARWRFYPLSKFIWKSLTQIHCLSEIN